MERWSTTHRLRRLVPGRPATLVVSFDLAPLPERRNGRLVEGAGRFGRYTFRGTDVLVREWIWTPASPDDDGDGDGLSASPA